MIPENFVREWQDTVPWKSSAMVEQDLIICRALVALYSDHRAMLPPLHGSLRSDGERP